MASKLSSSDLLKRIIYTSGFNAIYNSGNPDAYSFTNPIEENRFIKIFVQTNFKSFTEIISKAANHKCLPRKEIIFFILAGVINSPSTSAEQKHELSKLVLKLCKNDRDFFLFISYSSTVRKDSKTKLSKCVLKIIKKFYGNKSPKDFAISYLRAKGYYSWTHKDLIKYAHIKGESPEKNVIINYILFEKIISEDHKTLTDILLDGDSLRKTHDVNVAVSILSKYKFPLRQFNPELWKSDEILKSVLPQINMREIIQCLPKLYKQRLLKSSTMRNFVIELLLNADKIKRDNIQPVEIFIGISNYENGGRAIHPHLLTYLRTEIESGGEWKETLLKFKKLLTAIQTPILKPTLKELLSLSYSNVGACGKKFLITIDVTDKKTLPCIGNRNIQCIQAALAIAMNILKTERNVQIATFNNKQIVLRDSLINKSNTFEQNLSILQLVSSDYIRLTSPVEWAMRNSANIDVFLNFVNSHESFSKMSNFERKDLVPVASLMQSYRLQTNITNAKLISVCLGSTHLQLGAETSPNILKVVGFDKDVAKTITAFSRNIFS